MNLLFGIPPPWVATWRVSEKLSANDYGWPFRDGTGYGGER